MAKYEKEIAPYASGRGTMRFPIDEPLPLALIAKLAKVRVQENVERELARKTKRKAAKKNAVKKNAARSRA